MNKKLLAKNSYTGAIQKLIVAILTFATIPVFIRLLGSEAYGIFATVAVIGALDRVTNLGLSVALIKFISQQGRTKESDYDIIIAISILLSLLLPLSILLIIFHQPILKEVLNIPFNEYENARLLYFQIVVANFLIFLGAPFSAVIESQGMIYKVSYLRLFNSSLYWGFIMISLLMGYGLPMIGTSIMSAAIIWFIATLIVCYKTWGRIRIKGMRPHAKRIVKKQLKYSLQIYASALIGLAYDPVTKVLISNFFGVTLVGVFDIALRIKRQIYSLMQQGLWPLFQLFSELKDKEKIRLLVHDLEQKIFYFVVPFFVVLLFITKPIITIWIGENIEVTSLSVICITGIYLLFSITVHPNYFFLTSRRPMKIVFIQLSNVFINLIVILATFKFLGYNAVMLSYFAAIFVAFLWGLHFQKKYLDSRIFDSFSQIIKLSATFLVLLGVGYVMDNLLNNNILKIVVQPITIGFLTLLIYRTVNLVNMEDIDRYFTRDGKLKKLAIALFIK